MSGDLITSRVKINGPMDLIPSSIKITYLRTGHVQLKQKNTAYPAGGAAARFCGYWEEITEISTQHLAVVSRHRALNPNAGRAEMSRRRANTPHIRHSRPDFGLSGKSCENRLSSSLCARKRTGARLLRIFFFFFITLKPRVE